MGWQGVRAKIKIDFFRLLTLIIVLVFLGLTVARMQGISVDDMIYNSWTNITMTALPSSGIKEGAEKFGSRRRDYNGKGGGTI